MNVLIPVFLFVYAIERCRETFWKRRKINGQLIASYSLTLIVIAYIAIYLVVLWNGIVYLETPSSIWLEIAGILMVLVSTMGRNWAIRSLGAFHSIQIEIQENHELIMSGPYEWVRNPYYLSNIIEALGLSLIVRSGIALMITGFVYLPLLTHRMLLEEKALHTHFGLTFDDYENHVPLILPNLARISNLLKDRRLRSLGIVNSSGKKDIS